MESPDILHYLRFAAALLFVLCLMGGLAFILRKFNIGSNINASSGKRRLKMVESLPLDSRRRAVLIKRDEREHLVILGANGETVVETGIEPPGKQEDGNDR